MTAELATTDIEVLPAARPASADAIGQLMAHAEAMTAAKQLADALCASELVPATYRGKPGNGAAAILYGAELGLNPIQSLQQIFVVHGSPAIYARTAVALVMRAGIIVETIASSDDSVTVRATNSRTGQVEESTWDIARATKAGYTSNKKYDTDPQAMLYAKAAMECCRKIAPDVLLGIPYSREELDLETQPVRVRSERGGRGLAGLQQKAAAQVIDADPGHDGGNDQQEGATPSAGANAKPPAGDQGPGGMSEATRKRWLNRMFGLLADADCPDRDDQLIVITALAGRTPADAPEHRDDLTDDELRNVVNALNTAQKSNTLGQIVTDVINTEIQRQANEEEDGDA